MPVVVLKSDAPQGWEAPAIASATVTTLKVDEVVLGGIAHDMGGAVGWKPNEVSGTDRYVLVVEAHMALATEHEDPLLLDRVHVRRKALLAGGDARQRNADVRQARGVTEPGHEQFGAFVERVAQVHRSAVVELSRAHEMIGGLRCLRHRQTLEHFRRRRRSS